MQARTRRLLEKNGLSLEEYRRRRSTPGDPLYEEKIPAGPRPEPTLHSKRKPVEIPAVIRYQAKTEGKLRKRVQQDIKPILREYFEFDPMDFHLELLQLMFQGGKYIVNFPTDHGKAVSHQVIVPLVDGSKCHGDLQLGDMVFGPDGAPTPVVAMNPPLHEPMMEVYLSDGSSVVCHPRHEWTVWCRGDKGGAYRTFEAQHLARLKLVSPSSNGTGRVYDRPHYQLDRAQALQLPEADLPVDPYTLGYWLGNGTTGEALICGAAADMEHVVPRIPYDRGHRKVHSLTGVVYQYFLDLSNRLRTAGVFTNKHIPLAYLRASERQRRALLAGLIDSDGHLGHLGKVRYNGINERLVRGVAELARTLGYRVTVHDIPPRGPHEIEGHVVSGDSPMWGCQWVPDDGMPQGSLPRKAVTRTAPRRRVGIVGIVGIEPAPPEEAHCIQVARPDGLYLVGENLHPTHNSMVSSFWFPILSLMEDPDQNHIICGANFSDSKRRVNAIKMALTPEGYTAAKLSNANLLRDYPWIAKPKTRDTQWAATQINVAGRSSSSPNPSVVAMTSNAEDVKGRRGKIIMDDLEGPKHRHSPTERQNLYEFVQLAAMRCYEDANESDRPLAICLGTPFDVDSVYFRLESLGWDVRRQPYKHYICDCPQCHGDPELAKRHDHGRLIWPQKRDKIAELRKTWTDEEFSIAMRMDPKGGDSSILSYQEIARLASDTDVDFTSKDLVCTACSGSGQTFVTRQGRMLWAKCPECNGVKRSVEPLLLVCLDPASGSKTRFADYAGVAVQRIMWVVGEQLPRVEILEAHRVTEGIFEQCRFAAHLASQYGAQVVYESNSQQGGNYDDVFKHLEATRVIPQVKRNRFFTSHNKWDGRLDVTLLKSMLRQGRLLVPQSRQQEKGVVTLFNEIRDLGSNSHDHIAMAVWMGIRWAYDNARMSRASTMKSPFSPSIASGYFRR